MVTEDFLARVVMGDSLNAAEARELMDRLISPGSTDVMKASFLSAMYFKGPTPDEIIGFSESLRSHAMGTPMKGLSDIVGTGGDGKNTINVSTAASITASAMGLPVAKHGNTGITSRHGSADFMKFIGYNFDRDFEDPVNTLSTNNFLYVFAPRFNNSFATFRDVRKKIGHRTVFNIMGPITNPFDPENLVIGTADDDTAESLAQVIKGRGRKGYVFHSEDGLDEISPSSITRGYIVNGGIRSITIDPEQITGRKIDLERVVAEDPAECFAKTLRGLFGRDDDTSAFIALNTAPALVLNERAASLEEGYALAMQSINDGKVEKQVKRLAKRSVEVNEIS